MRHKFKDKIIKPISLTLNHKFDGFKSGISGEIKMANVNDLLLPLKSQNIVCDIDLSLSQMDKSKKIKLYDIKFNTWVFEPAGPATYTFEANAIGIM